jgi:hypothetical protein
LLLFINIFNLQHFFYYRLCLLDVSWAQRSCLQRRMCGVKTAKGGCNSSSTTALNTSWYVCSSILFRKLLFSWVEYNDFFFNFQETYNSRLRERYENDHSTHPNLWMEAKSSGGPDKNQVYGLSNTTTENLRAARSVSTIGSSQSISSTQYEEIVALKQQTTHLTEQYQQLSADYEQFHQMVMDMRSQIGGTCVPLCWLYGPGNDQPLPPPAPPLF